MKRILLISLSLIFLAFFLAECGKDSVTGPTPPNPPTHNGGGNNSSYNKSDTTVTLNNGRLTIAIPAGDLKAGTNISMGSSNVAFVDMAHVLHRFQLLPEGTTFKKPVTLTFHYDNTWLKGNSPWNIGIAYRNDDNGNWYPAVNGKVDTDNHTISIKTKHFSHWSVYSCFHLFAQYKDKLSEDDSLIIQIKPNEKVYLLLSEFEPSVWESNADKSRHFGDPLSKPAVPRKIVPGNSYKNAVNPDAWYVNHKKNGDSQTGKISLLGGSGNVYQYKAPNTVPGNGKVEISAKKNTKKNGNLSVKQHLKIRNHIYGYMPKADIKLMTYKTGGTVIKLKVNSGVSGNTATAYITSVSTIANHKDSSKAIDTYDGLKTILKAWPSRGQYASYDSLRGIIDKLQKAGAPITDVDTSYSGFPIKTIISDKARAGDEIPILGSETIREEYNITTKHGSLHHYFAQKSFNKKGRVAGFDMVTTKAGTFKCLKYTYTHIVADTTKITGSKPAYFNYKISVTTWVARGIGTVKVLAEDPKTGITVTRLISINTKDK